MTTKLTKKLKTQKFLSWLFVLALTVVISVQGFSQQANIKISGVVTSSENGTEPLIGANILIKDTSEGTITDLDGSYEIEAPANGILIFSYTGYQRQEIEISNRTNIDVTMKPDILN